MVILSSRLLKKSSNSKIKVCLVKAGFYLLLICLQTLVAIDQNHATDAEIFLSFRALPSEWLCCWLETEQTPFSLTGHQFRSASLLLCTGLICSMLMLMNDCKPGKIEWKNSTALVSNKFLTIPWKFSFHMKKSLYSLTCFCQKFTNH